MQRENSLRDNLKVTNASFTKDAHLVAWATSVYPLFVICLIYLTWAAAWICLGHQPQADNYRDSPDSINIFISLLSAPAILLLITGLYVVSPMNILFTLITIIQRLRHKEKGALLLFMVPVIIWSLFFVVLVRDPIKIVAWFLN